MCTCSSIFLGIDKVVLVQKKKKEKVSKKKNSSSHITLSFLLLWKGNYKKRSYTPLVPSKTIPDSRPK